MGTCSVILRGMNIRIVVKKSQHFHLSILSLFYLYVSLNKVNEIRLRSERFEAAIG